MSATTATRPHVRPLPSSSDVRVVGALLRCKACDSQWQSPLDEWMEPLHLACPRCSRPPERPATA